MSGCNQILLTKTIFLCLKQKNNNKALKMLFNPCFIKLNMDLWINLSIHQSIYGPMDLYIHTYIYPSAHLSISTSINLLVHPSIH